MPARPSTMLPPFAVDEFPPELLQACKACGVPLASVLYWSVKHDHVTLVRADGKKVRCAIRRTARDGKNT